MSTGPELSETRELAMNLSSRLKIVRVNLKLTQEQFAAGLDISYGTYQKLEQDPESTIRSDLMEKLVKRYNVDPRWLLFGDEETPLPQGSEARSGFSLIPFFTQPASAGHGALVEDSAIGKFIAFRTDWLKGELGAHIQDLYCMRVSGESMESPTGEYRFRELRHGDLILVDRSFSNLLSNNIYVISVGDDIYVKAYRRLQEDSVEFYSFNPAYTPLVFGEKNRHLLRIEGRVSWVGRTIV